MTIALVTLSLLLLTLSAAFYYVVRAFLDFLESERRKAREERLKLLDRIQAPETVAAQTFPPPSDVPLAIQPDDPLAWKEELEARREAVG